MGVYEPSTVEVALTVIAGTLLAGPLYLSYVERLGLRGDERLIDLGGGAGNLTLHLARALEAGGGEVTYVDPSERWLAVARRRLRRCGNVSYHLGDIATLRPRDDSYDAAVIHFVLHEISTSDRPGVLQRLADALAPGGRVYIREPLRYIGREEIEGLMREAGLAQVDATTYSIPTQGEVYEGAFRKEMPAAAGEGGQDRQDLQD